jgi:methylenetetrahydrofolate dehydrogenase (NADP+)/methenyltetrahydrofolate cyclohydrolase
VGDDPASAAYVAGKEKDAHAVGMASFVHRLPASTSQDELMDLVRDLNGDPAVRGIIVQMPLPPQLDAVAAQEALNPLKDVDGLHPENAGLLSQGRPRFVPCTPLGIQVLLERSGTQVDGAHVVVVGRSQLVGRPVSVLLSNKARNANATVTLCHTGTPDGGFFTRTADILIVAAGRPGALGGSTSNPELPLSMSESPEPQTASSSVTSTLKVR